jgi:hypothetical protein
MKGFPPLGFMYIDESQFAQVNRITRVEGVEQKFEDGRNAKTRIHFDDGTSTLSTWTLDKMFQRVDELLTTRPSSH